MKRKAEKIRIVVSSRRSSRVRRPAVVREFRRPLNNLPKPINVQRLQTALMREVGPKRARELRALMVKGRELQNILDRLAHNSLELGVDFGCLAQARTKLRELLMWAAASMGGGES